MKEHLITIHFVEYLLVKDKFVMPPGYNKLISFVSNQENWDKLAGSMENYHSIGKALMPYQIGGVLPIDDIFSLLNKIKTNVAPDDHITIIINGHNLSINGGVPNKGDKHIFLYGVEKVSETSSQLQPFGIYTAEDLVKPIQEIFNQPLNIIINSCYGIQAVKDIKELGVLMPGSKVMSTDSQFEGSDCRIMETTIESMMANKEAFSFEKFAKKYVSLCKSKDALPEIVNIATNASFISHVPDSDQGINEQYCIKLAGEVLEPTG